MASGVLFCLWLAVNTDILLNEVKGRGRYRWNRGKITR